MIEEFDFETPSIGRFNKNITITPKNISFTNKSCIRLDKNFEPSIRIDGGLSQLFMYANFHIYVLSDDGLVTMKTEIKTDISLIWFMTLLRKMVTTFTFTSNKTPEYFGIILQKAL